MNYIHSGGSGGYQVLSEYGAFIIESFIKYILFLYPWILQYLQPYSANMINIYNSSVYAEFYSEALCEWKGTKGLEQQPPIQFYL